MFGTMQPGAARAMSMPLPIQPPRGIFGKRRRDTFNQAPSRPSEVQAAAGQGQDIVADPEAEEEQLRAMVQNLPGNAGPQAMALRERMQSQDAEPSPSHWSVGNFDRLRSAIPSPQPRPGGPLGGSLREPFDYDAAMAALAGDQKRPKDWQVAMAIVGDALSGMNEGGSQPYALQSVLGRRNAQQERLQAAAEQIQKWRYQDYSRQNEADLRAANPFTIGRDRVMYDPASGQAQTIYDGAEDFELYAEELGLEPGSPEYFQAVEDFVLRSSGPSAHERDIELDDHRTGNDRSLENLRYGNRRGLETLRQGNRRGMVDYRNANPPPSRSSRERLPIVSSPAEAMKLPPGTKFRTPDGKVKVRP